MEKKLVFLLVCEGPTDISFLKKLSEKIGGELNTEIELVELSPQKDATTETWPPHGWTKVRSWCKSWKFKTQEEIEAVAARSPFSALLQRKYWKALVDIRNADGLIIQMDTDIAEKIVDYNCKFVDYNGSRRDFCEKSILFWLGETAESIDGAYLLLPSFAIETWLLASHDPEGEVFDDLGKPFNYETLSDVETRLVNIGYPSKVKNGRHCLIKKENKHSNYAEQVFMNLDKVKERCGEAERYCLFLTDHCENH